MEEEIKINKEEFLMIASFHYCQMRYDEAEEQLRFERVSEILSKFVDMDEIHEFQDKRERQFLKGK